MSTRESRLLLLGLDEPALLSVVEPALLAAGDGVKVVLSADAALEAMTGPNPPDLALLDARLPGMRIEQLLAAARTRFDSAALPIVLISDAITSEWIDRVREGTIQDVIPRSADVAYWQLRVELVLRHNQMVRELSRLRETVVVDAQRDRLTGLHNREALLAVLFCETDRAQRMNSSLCLVLFDIDDFGHWNSRLGTESCDELLRQVAVRSARLLRSYDLLGRVGKDEFLVVLPGCIPANAVMLAERLRTDVFSVPFRGSGESIRLSACFGVASSRGRSPVVVLREAELALAKAREAGPETIQCFGEAAREGPPPVTFLSPTSGDELVAW